MKDELFAAAALEPAGDNVVHLYEILLGRDPENSFVIEEARSQQLNNLFRSFVGSTEFLDEVVKPFFDGRPLRHEFMAPRPTPEQCSWIASLLELQPSDEQSIRFAGSWSAFFEGLLAVLGLSPERETEDAGNVSGAKSITESVHPKPSGVAVKLAISRMQEKIAEMEADLEELKEVLAEMSNALEVDRLSLE